MKRGHKYQKVSILIPCYNEWSYIEEVVKRVYAANVLGLQREVIVIDDGSTDGSKEAVARLKATNLKKILLPANRGKGYALREGLKQATGEIVIVQDADLEYDPRDYKRILKPILSGKARVVYGSRELTLNTHSSPWFYLGGLLVTELTNRLFGGKLTDVPTGYKVFETSLLKSLPLKCVRFEFCPEVSAYLLKRGEKIVEIPIRYQPRRQAEGKKIKLRDAAEAVWTLLSIRLKQ